MTDKLDQLRINAAIEEIAALRTIAAQLADALAGIQYGYLTNHLRFACPKCRVIDSHEQGCSVGKALAAWKEWKRNGS